MKTNRCFMEYTICMKKVSESLYETRCQFPNHSGGQIHASVRNNGEISIQPRQKLESVLNFAHACTKSSNRLMYYIGFANCG